MLLFDGDCAFCRRCVALFRRWGAKEIKWLPYQSFDDRQLEAMGTSREECEQAIQFIAAPQVGPVSGAEAINAILFTNPRLRPLASLLRKRAVLPIERAFYNFVGRHRATLSRLFGAR
jgi:predicted DCC family thiol-disulfide oxidoreductase YuxK